MQKRYFGLGLLALAFLFAKFSPFDGLSFQHIGLMTVLGAMAWIGVSMFMGTVIPNPAGPSFSMWKMLLNGALGMIALTAVLTMSIITTDNYVKKELQTYGVIANAVVTGKDKTKLLAKWGKVNYVHKLFISFQDQIGTPQQVGTEVNELEYQRAYNGMTLKIKYSSRDVDVHQLIFEQ